MTYHGSRRPGVAPPSSSYPTSLFLRLTGRRAFFASCFAFAVAAASVISAKAVHVYAHLNALAISDVAIGVSFFTQDVLFLMALRLLLDGPLAPRSLRILCSKLAWVMITFCFVLAAISMTFFFSGTELHWRNANVASQASSWGMLLTGLFSCSVVVSCIFISAWILQDLIFVTIGIALAVARWPFAFILSKMPARVACRLSRRLAYQHVAQDDDMEGGGSERKRCAEDDDDDDDGR